MSTAGHHVSAMTLADGVFHRRVGRRRDEGQGFGEDDWDPERSLGRLVGELGRVMSDVRSFLLPITNLSQQLLSLDS